uniref:protein zer-1 homolog isoform X2 n=1 Tax=Myxine glutinosa TaxID=7769 RepID=UPI00358F2958
MAEGLELRSLAELCVQCCLVQTVPALARYDHTNTLCLHPGLKLPSDICDRLVNSYVQQFVLDVGDWLDGFLELFSDPKSTRLQRLCLRNFDLQEKDLDALSNQELTVLDLTQCDNVGLRAWRYLLTLRGSLTVLSLYGCTPRFNKDEEEEMSNEAFTFEGFDRLRELWLSLLPPGRSLATTLGSLPSLLALHLSDISLPHQPTFLLRWRTQLVSLSLANCDIPVAYLHIIRLLEQLRHLDLSVEKDKTRQLPLNAGLFSELLSRLPHLQSLDLSGQLLRDDWLVAPGKEEPSIEPAMSSLLPLRVLKRPLHFLGLFHSNGCEFPHLPAHVVTGDECEVHILNALDAYSSLWPSVTVAALKCLFNLVCHGTCNHPHRALMLVITVLHRNHTDPAVQTLGSGVLYYLTCLEYRAAQGPMARRAALATLLSGLKYASDIMLQKNWCLTLCNFSISDELCPWYARTSTVLLEVLRTEGCDAATHRIAVHLCNALVCQLDSARKCEVGRMGFVQVMLALINGRLEKNTCDHVMELSWSALWNITDETPSNCELFLHLRGMDYFLTCLSVFPNKPVLHTNLLGLLGNVAEVHELRPHLLTTQYISIFSKLLESTTDGIEVSYNACGVLSHIMADGPEAWLIEEPSRQAVEDRMWSAITSWDVHASRNINYRSFEPILRLVPHMVAPIAQHWATWALLNLTIVDPSRYCPLLVREGGTEILQSLLENPGTHPETRDMAARVVDACKPFSKDF